MLFNLIGDDVDDRFIGEHAGFHRVSADVGYHRVDLRRDEFGTERKNCAHADGVLRGDGGDRRGAVDAESGKSFQIGLNARAGARVGAGDGERFANRFHDRAS